MPQGVCFTHICLPGPCLWARIFGYLEPVSSSDVSLILVFLVLRPLPCKLDTSLEVLCHRFCIFLSKEVCPGDLGIHGVLFLTSHLRPQF